MECRLCASLPCCAGKALQKVQKGKWLKNEQWACYGLVCLELLLRLTLFEFGFFCRVGIEKSEYRKLRKICWDVLAIEQVSQQLELLDRKRWQLLWWISFASLSSVDPTFYLLAFWKAKLPGLVDHRWQFMVFQDQQRERWPNPFGALLSVSRPAELDVSGPSSGTGPLIQWRKPSASV